MMSKIKNHVYALLFFVGAFFCISNVDAALTTPSSIYSIGGSWGDASLTIDGDVNTGNSYLHEVPNADVTYDLGSSQHITQVQMWFRTIKNVDPIDSTVEPPGTAPDIDIYVSDDPNNFPATPVVEDWQPDLNYWATSPSFDAVGQYVRFDFTNGGGTEEVTTGGGYPTTYTAKEGSFSGWEMYCDYEWTNGVSAYDPYYGYTTTIDYYYCRVDGGGYTTTEVYDPRLNEVLIDFDAIPTGGVPIDINVEVQETLSLDCHDSAGTTGDYDVLLGTASDPGRVTAGIPAIGGSTCDVTTNDDQGYYLTLVDDNGAANAVLTHNDPNTAAVYQIADLAHYSFVSSNTQKWSVPATKGLGFSVVGFPDADMTNNDFDGVWTTSGDLCEEGIGSDQADYAGIPDTAEAIAAVTQYEAGLTTTDVCYKVDVPASQASGVYTGSVTYTATSDASTYYN